MQNKSSKPKDTAKNIMIFWMFLILIFAYQYGIRISIPSVLNEDLQQHFVITAEKLGALISGSYMVYMLMQIPVGIIIDKFNIKSMAIASTVLTSIATIGFISTNNFSLGILFQLLVGASSSFAFTMVLKVANDYFPKERVAIATNLAFSFVCLGIISIGIILAYLSQIYHWENIVFCFGMIGLFLAFSLFFIPNIHIYHKKKEGNNDKSGSANAAIKSIFCDRRYILIGLFSMTLFGAGSAFSETWGVSFITSVYGIDKIKATSIVSIYFVGIIIGGPMFAYVSNLLNSYKKSMLIGSSLMTFSFLVIICIKENFLILNMMIFLLGISASSNNMSFLLAFKISTKDINGSVAGSINTMAMLGSVIIIPTVGTIIDISKKYYCLSNYSAINYRHGITVLLVSSLIATITAYYIEKHIDEKQR